MIRTPQELIVFILMEMNLSTFDLEIDKLETSEKNNISEVKLLAPREATISVWLDNFDDIFSDFDPRTYSERTISDDFLNELRKRTAENNRPINEIRLQLPEKERKSDFESLIAKRIHQIIKLELKQHMNQLKRLRAMGFLFLSIGIILIFFTMFSEGYSKIDWIKKMIYALTEPSGWFFTWNGLDKLFSSTEKKLPELIFFRKLSKAKVIFTTV
jgi:Fe2+ transport system protein B